MSNPEQSSDGERREPSLKIFARPLVVCSNVAVDYFLYLSRCVGGSGATVRLVHALDETTYRRLARGGRIARLRLRAAMYLGYPCKLVWSLLRAPRNACFIVTSNTFFAPALAASFGRLRGIEVIHLLYDLFPDAMEVAGLIRPDGATSRLLGRVARMNLCWPTGVVFLGARLRQHAERRWGRARRAAVIDISTDVRQYPTTLPALPDSPLRLHYGGQLGAMHDADSLIAAMRAAARAGFLGAQVEGSFYLSGGRAAAFTQAIAGCGLEVRPTLPAAEWRVLAARMHIGLVTLGAGGATVCLPSKTYAMMASGMAIVAICPVWSDLAVLVRGSDAGWVIDNAPGSRPDEPASWPVDAAEVGVAVGLEFVSLLERLTAHPEEVRERRGNAYKAAHGRYGVAAIESRWAAFLGGDGETLND